MLCTRITHNVHHNLADSSKEDLGGKCKPAHGHESPNHCPHVQTAADPFRMCQEHTVNNPCQSDKMNLLKPNNPAGHLHSKHKICTNSNMCALHLNELKSTSSNYTFSRQPLLLGMCTLVQCRLEAAHLSSQLKPHLIMPSLLPPSWPCMQPGPPRGCCSPTRCRTRTPA